LKGKTGVRVDSRSVKDVWKYLQEDRSVIESTANTHASDNCTQYLSPFVKVP